MISYLIVICLAVFPIINIPLQTIHFFVSNLITDKKLSVFLYPHFFWPDINLSGVMCPCPRLAVTPAPDLGWLRRSLQPLRKTHLHPKTKEKRSGSQREPWPPWSGFSWGVPPGPEGSAPELLERPEPLRRSSTTLAIEYAQKVDKVELYETRSPDSGEIRSEEYTTIGPAWAMVPVLRG